MEKWCPVVPNLKSLTFERSIPKPECWLNSEGEFVLKQLTKLHEIVFYNDNRSYMCFPLHSGEVIARAWKATVELPRRDLVVWKCSGFTTEHFKHLRSLGLNVIRRYQERR